MRLIAIVVSVLMVSLSIPHFSLWSFGVAAGNAAETITPGGSCTAPAHGCGLSSSRYYIYVCSSSPPAWTATASNYPTVSECNQQCGVQFGADCITSSPNPPGLPNSATVTFNPSSPGANQQFNIRFTLPSSVPSGSRIEFVLDSTRTAACSGTVCSLTTAVSIPGTYPIAATLFTPAGQSSLSLTPTDSIIVGQGTGGAGVGCCAEPIGNGRFNYKPNVAEATCRTIVGAVWGQTCGNIEGNLCRGFCSTQSPVRSGGTCNVPGNEDPQRGLFSNVCYNGMCQCGPVDTQAQRRQESCMNFCLTDTQYSGFYSPQYTQQALRLPIPQCTSNPQLFLSTFQTIGTGSGTTTGVQGSVERWWCGNQGENQCDANEKCCCILTRVNTVSTSTPNTPATIPGTQGTPRWNPPDAIESPPQKTPNERKCDVAVNATITASFGTAQSSGEGSAQISGLRLVRAGDPITIVGKVTKLTDRCDGYQYQCRAQQEVNCKADTGFLKTSLDYQSCPASMPDRIHEQGEKSVTNVRRIVSIVLTVVEIAALVAGLPIPPEVIVHSASGIATSSCGQQQVDALITTAFALTAQQIDQNRRDTTPTTPTPTTPPPPPSNTCEGCLSGRTGYVWCVNEDNPSDRFCISGSCPQPGYVGYTTCGSGTGSVTTDPTFKVNGEAIVTGNAVAPPDATGPRISSPQDGGGGGGFDPVQLAAFAPLLAQLFPACPSPEDVLGCFSVCGKEYETRATYAPTCERGGPVIGYKDAEYFCGQGDCGGFAGKRVTIKVYGPDGGLAVDDSVTAGSNGEFSYTFNSPAGDGDFTVLVAAPREG